MEKIFDLLLLFVVYILIFIGIFIYVSIFLYIFIFLFLLLHLMLYFFDLYLWIDYINFNYFCFDYFFLIYLDDSNSILECDVDYNLNSDSLQNDSFKDRFKKKFFWIIWEKRMGRYESYNDFKKFKKRFNPKVNIREEITWDVKVMKNTVSWLFNRRHPGR